MSILKQTYWKDDTDEQGSDKLSRLHALLDARQFDYVVEVKRYVKKYSRAAEDYLWGVCYPLMSEASGYEKEELHYTMCCKFFGTRIATIMGTNVEVPMRTTTTNVLGEKEPLGAMDYWDFTDFVIREAATWFDVAIPPPDPELRTR